MGWLKYPGAIMMLLGIALVVGGVADTHWSAAVSGGRAGVGAIALSGELRS